MSGGSSYRAVFGRTLFIASGDERLDDCCYFTRLEDLTEQDDKFLLSVCTIPWFFTRKWQGPLCSIEAFGVHRHGIYHLHLMCRRQNPIAVVANCRSNEVELMLNELLFGICRANSSLDQSLGHAAECLFLRLQNRQRWDYIHTYILRPEARNCVRHDGSPR